MKRRPLSMAVAGIAAALAALLPAATGHSEGAAAPDGSVRRLTEAQYRRTIADVFGSDIRVVGRFEPDLRVDGLLAVGTSAISVTPGGFDQYEEIARGIATQVTDADHRERLVGCAPGPQDADGRTCAGRFFDRVGPLLFRRPLSPAERTGYVDVTLTAARTLGGFDAGLAASLAGMLSSPHYLFRMEAPGADGRLDAYARASRLSFFLWNAPPDQALLDAARGGALSSDAGIAAQVDRLMASPRFVDGMRAFFTDFLLLDDMDGLAKDSLIYPQFNSSIGEMLKEQTLRTLTDLLVTRRGDYRNVFTTRRMAMRRELGPIYTIPLAGTDWTMYEFPDGDPRGGLLTHAGLLALHSHPGRTSPTLRGKAVREALMCQKIPAPPANVSFAVVQDVNNPTLKTTRARLQAHLDDDECASCHRKTDPIGLGLENFDGVGRFRLTEHGERIDASGTFDGLAFSDANTLGRLFHDSSKVASCVVRSTWRYAYGRNPVGDDEQAIEAFDAGFARNGYRMVDLMRAIAIANAADPKPRAARRTVALTSGRSPS